MKVNEYPQLLDLLGNKLKEPLPNKEALAMIFPDIKSLPSQLPDDAKLSAVMLLLYQKTEEWHLLAIKRTEDGNAHSGQIGFPGGRYEPNDTDLLATALRETFEELGILQERVKPIGALSPVYISVSNFNVFPFIGFVDSVEQLRISEQEVQAIIQIPLSALLSPNAKVEAEVISPIQPNLKRKVNAYQLPDNSIIWGATALMIAELELLLRN